MSTYKRALMYCTTMGYFLLVGWNAAAAEIGDFCWQTESGNLMRFSVSEAGPGHFTYTGMFTDTDGADFAILGHVAVVGSSIVGSFSGAKTAADKFKTAIYRVTFNPATLVGSGEGIRQVYDRLTAGTSTDYKVHTLTPTPCP